MNKQRAGWASRFLLASLAISLVIMGAGCHLVAQQDMQPLAERSLVFGPYVTAVSPEGAQG